MSIYLSSSSIFSFLISSPPSSPPLCTTAKFFPNILFSSLLFFSFLFFSFLLQSTTANVMSQYKHCFHGKFKSSYFDLHSLEFQDFSLRLTCRLPQDQIRKLSFSRYSAEKRLLRARVYPSLISFFFFSCFYSVLVFFFGASYSFITFFFLIIIFDFKRYAIGSRSDVSWEGALLEDQNEIVTKKLQMLDHLKSMRLYPKKHKGERRKCDLIFMKI